MNDTITSEDLRELSSKLRELSELSSRFIQSMSLGLSNSDLAEQFLRVSQEAMRGAALLDFLREADRQRQENQTLMQISMNLSSAAGIENVLRTILDSLRQVVDFAAGGIFVYNRELGQIDIDMLSGYESEKREKIYRKFEEGIKIGQGITGAVIQTGEAIYVPDIRKDSRYIEVRESTLSEIAVPIIVRGEVIGAFNLESDHLNAFDTRDLSLLRTFANHAAAALERARADRLKQHAKRIEEEIALAQRIQDTFLPRSLPDFTPYELGGLNSPSSEVGGDYYDFIPITENDLGVAIGDVTGHGIGAALLMANFRACLRIESRNNFAIRTILSKVNEYLIESNLPDSFVTAFYGVLDRTNHRFTYANAGHNSPFVMHANGKVESLDKGGLLLGAFPDVSYEESILELHAGDILVFYTDGVTESRNGNGEEFGSERLEALVKQHRKLPAQDMVKTIAEVVHQFQSDNLGQDDLTLSIVKYV